MKPKPYKFPLPEGTPSILLFNSVLRNLIGGRTRASREPIFRHFWDAQREKWSQCPVMAPRWLRLTYDGGDAVRAFKASGVPMATLYDWNSEIPQWRTKNQAARNRENALKRWQKQKSLTHPKRKK